MALTQEEITRYTNRRAVLVQTQQELEAEYNQLLGSKYTPNVALQSVGEDLLSVKQQIADIDSYLVAAEITILTPEIPRREPFPTSPTVLVTGNPNDRGIPMDVERVEKSNGEVYYVDKQGRVIDRRTGN